IQMQKVIKSLYVMMIGVPSVFIIVSWNRPGFSPTILKVFKGFEVGVHVIAHSRHGLQFLYDRQAALQIFLKVFAHLFIIIVALLLIFKIKFIEFPFSGGRIGKIDDIAAILQEMFFFL